ncbi:hypothetical protein AB9T89_09925 [Flavobacterium oncorhynchi]|uniref:hypothetical protein n=1 Tax=Flavobacterium oncorhynchi TaxID=728056 RepID=UPI00351A424A
MIDKTIKNRIANDWQSNFPELTIYSLNKFYKIAGCVIFGIELIKLPRNDEYRPHFVIYPLWKKNLKECLEMPIVMQQFCNKRNFQFDIPYEYSKHVFYFEEVIKVIKKECPFLFEEYSLAQSIVDSIDNYSQTKRFSIAPNSYFQAEFLQVKMEIVLYKSTFKAQEILNKIKGKGWDIDHFQSCGVNIKEWFSSLQEEIDDRNLFLKQIEINKAESKLKKLKKSDLRF